MEVDRHELEYQAQGHWHGFKYRWGEMIGIDRAQKLVHLNATFDEDGREITPVRSFKYDYLVDCHRQRLERLRHARREGERGDA